tara:strand:- start:151 stop:309 length:159 start_codon:yes stop_codon:yes gene_type:complete
MALDSSINRATGQRRVIRKKGDLTGVGKGDWQRVPNNDKQYIENYNKIDWSK